MKKMNCEICYAERFTWFDMWNDKEDFINHINTITEEEPLFDLEKLWNHMEQTRKYASIKHTSREGFKQDLNQVWNTEIFSWNRKFELLNRNYEEYSGTETKTEGSISNSGESTKFEKPQFNALRENPSELNDVSSAQTEQQTITTRNKIENEKINRHLKQFDRFKYEDIVEGLEPLFLNLLLTY